MLGTVTVDAGGEVAELAGKDSAVSLAVMVLETVSSTLGAAVLTEAPRAVLEFDVVSTDLLACNSIC